MASSTATECLKRFCETVISIFGPEYLRIPTHEDMRNIMHVNKARGFPGMLGSLDCTHWEWKNCPVAWAGQYTGKEKKATIILEAVATHDLWIWHAFFGTPESNNDLNVLDQSPLLSTLASDNVPSVPYRVNGRHYDEGYYLTDGIYRPWPCLVQSVSVPLTEKDKWFNTRQEAVRKDIERAFGVLKARWSILANPARHWDRRVLHNVMISCIILHNMIVEDERELEKNTVQTEPVACEHRTTAEITFLQRYRALRDTNAGTTLRADLIEHLWQQKNDGDGSPDN